MANKKEETGIVDGIVQHIKDRGGDAYKTLGSAAQRGGEPDVTGEIYSERIAQWVHLKLEVKTDEGEASARQDFRIELYEKRGYAAGIVRSTADVDLLITAFEDKVLAAREEAQKEELIGYIPLEMANQLELAREMAERDDMQQRTEIATLRSWIDRFYRSTQWVDVAGLQREVKKALDWL